MEAVLTVLFVMFLFDAAYKVRRIRNNDLTTTPTLLAADAAINAVIGAVGLILVYVAK